MLPIRFPDPNLRYQSHGTATPAEDGLPGARFAFAAEFTRARDGRGSIDPGAQPTLIRPCVMIDHLHGESAAQPWWSPPELWSPPVTG